MTDNEQIVNPVETEEVPVEGMEQEAVAAAEAVGEAPEIQDAAEAVAEDAAEEVAEEAAKVENLNTAQPFAKGLIEKVKALPVKYLAIGGAGVVALILVLVLLFSITTPLGLVRKGVINSMKAIGKNPVVSLVDGVVNGGSAEVSVDLETISESIIGYPLLEGDASVKLYSDVASQKGALVADVSLADSLDLDAGVYLSKDSVAVSSQALLGSEAYGISLENLIDDFNNSEFGVDGAYSLDFEMPDSVDTVEMKQLVKDSEKLSLKLAAKILKTMKKNSEISKEKGSVSFAGEDAKTTDVSIKMDYKQMSAFVTEMVQYVRKDKAIKEYLQEYANYIALASGGDEDEADELVEYIYDELDAISEDYLDELEEMLEDADTSVEVIFHITKSKKQLVGIEIKAEAYDEQVKASLIAGPTMKKIDEISFRATVYGETYRISYVVKNNDRKEYKAEFKIREDDYVATEASVKWDKKLGDFKVKFSDGWDEYDINGTFDRSGKETTIFVKNVSVDGEKTKLDTTIVLSTSDKFSAPAYKDVLQMSADQIQEAIDAISETAQDLASEMGGLAGMLYGGYYEDSYAEAYPDEYYYYDDEYYYYDDEYYY